MAKALMNIEEQISFLSYFAQERNNSNRLGVAKGKGEPFCEGLVFRLEDLK